MANTLTLEIITPEGTTSWEDVELVTLPASKARWACTPGTCR